MLTHNNSLPIFVTPCKYLSNKPLSSENNAKSSKSMLALI